jgi:NADPH2:quinone reductase
MSTGNEMMYAIVVREFGGPEVLRLEQVPVPDVGPGELLVEVHAAGVNPVDVSNHEDGEWAGIEPPYTPGSDVSGVVRAFGEGVTRFAAGDEIFALTDFLGVRRGSYAEYQVVHESVAVLKPASLSHVEAASVPLAAGTAYEVVVRRLELQRDERVVIFGAAGGVGGFATQLAIQHGAGVIAVGRAAAHDYLRSLGAALMLDYTAGDAIAQVADAVGEVDAVIDLVGGHTVEQGLQLVREGGRMATIASLAGDLEPAIDRNLTLHGVLVRPDAMRLETLARLLESGALRTTVRSEHALADAEGAHREVLRGGVPGKTVLRIR